MVRELELTTNSVTVNYDAIGELAGWSAKELNGTLRQNEQLGYNFDAAGNLAYRTNGSLIQNFQVNSVNELTAQTNGGKLTVVGTTTSLATGVTVNTTTALVYGDATFAATNMPLTTSYTAVAQDSHGRHSTNVVTVSLSTNSTFQYDGNGNLTNDGWRNFAYDAENQLVQVLVSNQWMSRFSYDGIMRRRVRTEFTWTNGAWSQTNAVYYVYDGNLVIQERDQYNLPTVTYTRGNDLSESRHGAGGIGGLLARTDATVGQTAYYHADGNGNVTMLINSTNAIVARYLYDGFGNILSKSGLLADANLYRFSSKEVHTSSGLVYYGYRFYDPNLQRWPNRDPIGELGGINLYAFAENNGLNVLDPFGLSYAASWSLWGAAAGAGVSAGASLVADAATGGLKVAATPAEVAGGATLGAAIGADLGALLDGLTGNNSPPDALPFPPLAADMAGKKDHLLPTGGTCPYNPKKQKGGGNPRNKRGDYLDDSGNGWRWDPIKAEWDVQTPDGGHINVNPDGEITH